MNSDVNIYFKGFSRAIAGGIFCISPIPVEVCKELRVVGTFVFV